jgi:hypothetical protein
MKKKTVFALILALSFLVMLLIQSCRKDKVATGSDRQLFDMSEDTSGFVWYKHSDVLLAKSAGSGHTPPYMRTRYNGTAAAMLDSAGKVKPGSLFPTGSLIVKELIGSGSTLERYAVLYKQPGSDNADARGWVWGYINADGTVAIAAEDKGAACISCHSQADNIDYMLMNKFFP